MALAAVPLTVIVSSTVPLTEPKTREFNAGLRDRRAGFGADAVVTVLLSRVASSLRDDLTR
jgi:hypothetical protein